MAWAFSIALKVGEEVLEEVDMLEPDAEEGVVVREMLVPNGLVVVEEMGEVAERRFSVVVPIMSCMIMGADLLFVDIGGPVR